MADQTVTQELPGGWVAVFKFEPWGPAELTIRPAEPGQPPSRLSSTVLRDISFAKAINELDRNERRWVPAPVRLIDDPELLRDLHAAGADSPEYLVALTANYAALVGAGGMKPGKARQRLAETIGDISESTIRNHLWRAKRAGLVTDSPLHRAPGLSPDGARVADQIVQRS